MEGKVGGAGGGCRVESYEWVEIKHDFGGRFEMAM